MNRAINLRVAIAPLLLLCVHLCCPPGACGQVPLAARWRAANWNMARILRPTNPNEDGVTLTSVAGARKRELRNIMKTFPAPRREELQGVWLGVNRGVGPAMLGISQFAKEFWTLDACAYGDNITMQQCDPEYWNSDAGWRPVVKEGQLDRHGNYRVNCPEGRFPFRHAVELNYGQAPNPRRSAERLIVDQLVKIDDDHMLGYAMIQVGKFRIGGIYFVLKRAG